MKIINKLAVLSLGIASTLEAWAQTAASLPASGASSVPLPGSPGSGVTWFIAGMVVGLVVGYMIGRNANKAAAAPPSVLQFSGTGSCLRGTCRVVSFTVGGRLVQTDSGTEFRQGNCTHLSNGMDIGVTGTLTTGGAVYATQVQLKGR